MTPVDFLTVMFVTLTIAMGVFVAIEARNYIKRVTARVDAFFVDAQARLKAIEAEPDPAVRLALLQREYARVNAMRVEDFLD